MWFKIIYLLSQYIIYDKNGLSEAKAMIGNLALVPQGHYKWIVTIKSRIDNSERDQDKYHGLTGCLISPRHVLTVEHGPMHVPISKLECRLGTVDIRNDHWKFNVTAFITFNQWAAANRIQPDFPENDIAILTLSQQVPDEIEPVSLSQLPERILTGLKARVAGWGLGGNNKIHRYMRVGIVKIITREQCKNRIFNGTGRITDFHKRFLCSYGEPYVILRKGDSGGPIFLQNGPTSELVGITHASCPAPDGYHPLKVNLHLGVNSYRYFIADIIMRF